MKHVACLPFAAAIICSLPAAADAQAVSGPYVDLGGGYNLLADIHAHSRDPALAQPRTNYRFGDGFVGAGSVGWGFGNVFYDVDLQKIGIPVASVQPYVGAGAGALWTHFSPITSAADDGSSVFRLGGTGENFAYQGIVGLGFPIKAVPGLKLSVD